MFADAYRVLRPGGRLAISDVVASAELPDEIRTDLDLYSGCVAGATLISELYTMLLDAGFEDVVIAPKDDSKSFIEHWTPGRSITDYVVSATIEAVRPPGRSGCC